jgi:hypothetical protein
MTEDTDKAKFHICHHDENPTKPCEAEKDISELTAEKPTTIIKKPLKTSFLQKVWESIVRMWKALKEK